VEGETLIISKGYRVCAFCGTKEIRHQIGTKFLCDKCLTNIKDF
jgi:NADH pyrophosphatase NudC (nudix superfamily)